MAVDGVAAGAGEGEESEAIEAEGADGFEVGGEGFGDEGGGGVGVALEEDLEAAEIGKLDEAGAFEAEGAGAAEVGGEEGTDDVHGVEAGVDDDTGAEGGGDGEEETGVGTDGLVVGRKDTVGDDEEVVAVVFEGFVGFGVEGVGAGVPGEVVDGGALAFGVGGEAVAVADGAVDEEDAVAEGIEADGAGEADFQERFEGEAVEGGEIGAFEAVGGKGGAGGQDLAGGVAGGVGADVVFRGGPKYGDRLRRLAQYEGGKKEGKEKAHFL